MVGTHSPRHYTPNSTTSFFKNHICKNCNAAYLQHFHLFCQLHLFTYTGSKTNLLTSSNHFKFLITHYQRFSNLTHSISSFSLFFFSFFNFIFYFLYFLSLFFYINNLRGSRIRKWLIMLLAESE